MPRDVPVKIGDETVVFSGVPDDVPDAMVQTRAKLAHYTDLGKEDVKNAYTGAVRGVTSQPEGMIGATKEALTNFHAMSGNPIMSRFFDVAGMKAAEGARAAAKKVNETVGATNVPRDSRGRFVASAAAGVTSALTPGSKTPVADALIGGASGITTQMASEAKTGPLGEVAAGTIPMLVATVLRRLKGRSSSEQVMHDVMQDTTPKEKAAAETRKLRAEGQGVTLLPGQTYGPDHPIAGLQESSLAMQHGGPLIQNRLRDQGARAKVVADNVAGSVGPVRPEQELAEMLHKAMQGKLEARRAGAREIVDPLYSAAKKEPLGLLDIPTLRKDLEGLKQSEQLAKHGMRAPVVDNTIASLIEGTRQVPPATRQVTRRTLTGGAEGPKKGTVDKTVVDRPGFTIKEPVQTVGQLQDLRDKVRDGWRDLTDLRDPIRAQIMDKINIPLHANPKMQAADAAYGAVKDIAVNPLTKPERQTPASAVLSHDTPSPAVLDSALDPKRYRQGDINSVLATVDGKNGSDFSRGMLSRRLAQAQDGAKPVLNTPDQGTYGAAFAQNLTGDPNLKGMTDALMARIHGPNSPQAGDMAEKLKVLLDTGTGRAQMGRTAPADLRGGGAALAPLAARAGGTNALLAAAPVIGKRIERAQQYKLAEALSDPTGRKIEELLKADPSLRAVMDSARTSTIAQGQGLLDSPQPNPPVITDLLRQLAEEQVRLVKRPR